MARRAVFVDVAKKIQERILTGLYPAAEPLPPERILAEELGINRLTLRKALDVLEQDQIIIRRQGCGTFVTPSKAKDTFETILYLGDTQGHFFQNFYAALCLEAQGRGQAITAFTPTADDISRPPFLRLLESHRRIICQDSVWRFAQVVIPPEKLVTRVSGVFSSRTAKVTERPGYVVSSDRERAAKLAVEYLVSLGHRRIAYLDAGGPIPGDPLVGKVNPLIDAYLGYLAGLNEAGINEALPLLHGKSPAGEDEMEWEYRALAWHLDRMKTPPTGFLCAADFRAGPLLRLLRERGIQVPHDASVIGIGNTPWSLAYDPALSSVYLGETEMARLALLLNAEPLPPGPRIVRIDPDLVPRKSTALPPG